MWRANRTAAGSKGAGAMGLLWLSSLAFFLLACDPKPPLRDCFVRVWIPTAQVGATVVGSWNGFREPGLSPKLHDLNWQLLRLPLPAGEHGYAIAYGGKQFVDPFNPLTTFHQGREVSLLLVPDCSQPRVSIERVAADETGQLTVSGRFLAASSGAHLDVGTVEVTTGAGFRLEVSDADRDTGLITARASGLGRGRHTITVAASDDDGVGAEPGQAAAWVAPVAEQWRDGLLYQVVIDRFRGDGGQPLAPPPTPGALAGGTLDGLRSELAAGTFAELGVSALWLSPVYDNPEVLREGRDGRMYESYHGYWVLNSRAVEQRIGGAAALDKVIATAHEQGIRVLLDLVPNHVYEDNPLYIANGTSDWFNPPGCVCGSADCPWGSYIQTCWFTPYLPDFKLEHPDTMGQAVDDASWWLERFPVDGVRIDAVPMMPRAATRRIAHRLRARAFPTTATFILGEVFTGPGTWGIDALRYHLGPAGFDSLFDFPLMWTLHDAIATGQGGFDAVEQTLSLSEHSYAGSNAVMARMLDNHDTPRFISVAHGDGYGDPWDSPAQQPTSPHPYARLRLALAVLMTLPGLPVLFQGDEIGLAGANDPDCRRVMPSAQTLTEDQRQVRDTVQQLGRLRRCSGALRRGDRRPVHVAKRSYGYVRGTDHPYPVLVVVAAESFPLSPELPSGQVPAGQYVDAFGGESFTITDQNSTAIPLGPLSFRILLRADDPCREGLTGAG